MLLAGVHFINSTTGKQLVKDLHSLAVIGEQSETTILLCTPGFIIEFNTCKNVSIFHVIFNSCTLLLSRTLENVVLTNITLLNGTLMIYKAVYNVAGNSDKQSVNCCQREIHNGPCTILENVSISNSTFSNSSIVSKSNIKGIDCLQLAIMQVLFKDMRNILNSFSIDNGYKVTIADVNFYSNHVPFWLLSISRIHTLILINTTIWNNVSPILSLNILRLKDKL